MIHLRIALPVLVGLLTLGSTAVAAPHPEEGQLRIRLMERQAPRAVEVDGPGGLTLYAGDGGAPLARLAPGERATVTLDGDELAVRLPGRRLHTRSLRLFPPDDGGIQITVVQGKRRDLSRRYQGSLFLSPDPRTTVLQLVNHVDVEDYVASVVASEYGLDDLEGSKAMAVIARTYALHALGEAGDAYDHVDHTLAQVYGGADRITDLARRAARETYGEVLTYDGHLIDAVYFSSSGGHTADNEAVWHTAPKPYLRGKKDPYDASPYATWSTSIDRDRLLDVLSRAFGERVRGIRVGARTRDGRVSTMVLLLGGGKRRTVNANDFRLAYIRAFGAATLRSTLFDVHTRGNDYVFQGHGFGHGVGLSQWGAHEMARRGKSYRDILAFYYTGVRLQKKVAYAGLHPAPRPSGGDVGATPPAEKPKPAPRRRRIGW